LKSKEKDATEELKNSKKELMTAIKEQKSTSENKIKELTDQLDDAKETQLEATAKLQEIEQKFEIEQKLWGEKEKTLTSDLQSA